MAIKGRLLELRFQIAVASFFAIAIFSFLFVGPRFATVINFFWPLLLSTSFFLAAVAVLLWISPPPAETSGDRAGEELMDYVTGQPVDDAVGGGLSGETEGKEEEDRHGKSE